MLRFFLFAGAICWAQIGSLNAQADDAIDKRCVAAGFQANTSSFERCVRKLSEAMGKREGADQPMPPVSRPPPPAVKKDCAECPEMVVIPPGSFMMGADTDAYEKPAHLVAVSSFLMGKTEVTQGQWAAVMGSNPSRFRNCGSACPVEQVNWADAQEFIRRLNQRAGLVYRLPSEAEWEYAARAGSINELSSGNAESRLRGTAWYSANSGSQTRAVGQKLPNAFGLFDMYGNVEEWTQDCWHGNYNGAPTDGSAWTTACRSGDRVLRGGSWRSNP